MKIRIATNENEARFHHYAAVVEGLCFDWRGTIEGPFDERSMTGIDAFIVSCDQHLPSRFAIAACGRLGIPTFHVLDGVVDWRTTFENPKFDPSLGGIPLFQPLIADHVFTMGQLQKWELEWLGNPSIHATGFPRFDRLPRARCRQGKGSEKPTILVATANSPWVTPGQEERITEEFRQLAKHLDALRSEGDGIKIIYRISTALADEIGVKPDCGDPASDALERCDAVITTPSTIAVEAMLAGVPTLIFDPFALPTFTPSAWVATDWRSVARSISSLLSPTKPLAAYQDQVLRMLVTADQGAAARIADIISAVVGQSRVPVIRTDAISRSNAMRESRGIDRHAAGLAATVAAMEKSIHNISGRLQESENAVLRPDFRFVAKSATRYLKQSFKRRIAPNTSNDSKD